MRNQKNRQQKWCVYIFVCIYRGREREREEDRKRLVVATKPDIHVSCIRSIQSPITLRPWKPIRKLFCRGKCCVPVYITRRQCRVQTRRKVLNRHPVKILSKNRLEKPSFIRFNILTKHVCIHVCVCFCSYAFWSSKLRLMQGFGDAWLQLWILNSLYTLPCGQVCGPICFCFSCSCF